MVNRFLLHSLFLLSLLSLYLSFRAAPPPFFSVSCTPLSWLPQFHRMRVFPFFLPLPNLLSTVSVQTVVLKLITKPILWSCRAVSATNILSAELARCCHRNFAKLLPWQVHSLVQSLVFLTFMEVKTESRKLFYGSPDPLVGLKVFFFTILPELLVVEFWSQ